MDKYKKSSKMTILVFSVTFLICGIWLGAWFVASQDMSIIRNLTAQPLADVFSSVNALFAGLAFGGVIITIYLQLGELKDTRRELQSTAQANQKMAHRADEKFILELFQTYCSEYFQIIKNDSQKVLFSCVASKAYCDFLVSRLFAAEVLEFPESDAEKISALMGASDLQELKLLDQKARYKFDEIINFFTVLAGDDITNSMVKRCDFSYSFWRPLFWLVALSQNDRYKEHEEIRKYCVEPTFLTVVKKMDNIYGFTVFETHDEFREYFINHPKIKPFMDPNYCVTI